MTGYTKPVCKGSWQLGTACGKCERCAETKPQMPPVAIMVTTEDALAFIGEACRNWNGAPLTARDVDDVRVALEHFLKHRGFRRA